MTPEIKMFFETQSPEYIKGYQNGYFCACERIKRGIKEMEKDNEPFSTSTATVNTTNEI